MIHNRNERTKTSIRTLQVLMVGLSLVILGRIFYLQIIQYETYAALGEKNSVRQEYVDPARGLIYDRYNKLIVDNEPIYTITITPANFEEEKIPFLASLLAVPDSLLRAKVNEAQRYSWHRSSRLFTEIDFETFSRIQENIWQLPGVGHQIESKRSYPLGMNASHLLGYLREANREEYQNSDDILLGDKIGKSGLEMIYEPELRGDLGLDYIKVNALGQSLGPYEGEKLGRKPVQGNDLITTLDAELQKVAEELMKGKRGGLVALNPQTGAVLAMVSSPDYDLKRLAGRLDKDYWQQINSDSTTPLYNRAISSRQPPGSTFKPIMGLVGMEMGIINPSTTVYNSGAYVRGRRYGDTAPVGNYDLKKALTFSSNTYFFALMDKIASNDRLDEWSRLVRDFGIGVSNPIDLPYASSGIVPDSSYMNSTFGDRYWGVGDLLSMGIGQGMVSTSPLQVAMMTSVIANGGYRIQPHVVQAYRKSDGSLEKLTAEKQRIPWIRDEYLDVVKEGMRGVVVEGSGRFYVNHPDIMIAGKTGTAQNPHGRDHGWFTSFAPMDNPEIVVSVLIENGGYGSISAAPVAALVIEQYLTGEIKRKRVLDVVLNFESRPTDSELLENE